MELHNINSAVLLIGVLAREDEKVWQLLKGANKLIHCKKATISFSGPELLHGSQNK